MLLFSQQYFAHQRKEFSIGISTIFHSLLPIGLFLFVHFVEVSIAFHISTIQTHQILLYSLLFYFDAVPGNHDFFLN